MNSINLRRHEVTLLPDSSRVIIRPFIPADPHRITTIVGRALALTEEEVDQELQSVWREFDSRHFDIDPCFSVITRKLRPISSRKDPFPGRVNYLSGPSFQANTHWNQRPSSTLLSSLILINLESRPMDFGSS